MSFSNITWDEPGHREALWVPVLAHNGGVRSAAERLKELLLRRKYDNTNAPLSKLIKFSKDRKTGGIIWIYVDQNNFLF